MSSDGVSGPLQSGSTGWQQLTRTWFYYGADTSGTAQCSFTLTGRTAVCDSDGHAVAYDISSQGNVWRTQVYSGSLWIGTKQSWDANNNRTSFTDPNGNETDFLYDQNGNLVEMAQPSVTNSDGTFRPTTLMAYDTNNNLIAYCDPYQTNSQRMNWSTATPSPAQTCPSGGGSTVLTWAPTPADPYGRLSSVTTPSGYTWTLHYSAASEGGSGSIDFALPTTVTGAATGDGKRIPSYSVAYDAFGDITSINPGDGNVWSLYYDASNRLTSVKDPNGDVSYVCYYGDDTVRYTETPHQHSLDGSPNPPSACLSTPPTYAVTYQRDPDGNAIIEIHHHGGVFNSNPLPTKDNVTTRYYDGLDRLVEVVQPQDVSDVYSMPWITRYIYDLTQQGQSGSGSVSFDSQTTALFPTGAAYGNLFKIEEYLPSGNPLTYTAPSPAPSIAPGQPYVVPQQLGNSHLPNSKRPTTTRWTDRHPCTRS